MRSNSRNCSRLDSLFLLNFFTFDKVESGTVQIFHVVVKTVFGWLGCNRCAWISIFDQVAADHRIEPLYDNYEDDNDDGNSVDSGDNFGAKTDQH